MQPIDLAYPHPSPEPSYPQAHPAELGVLCELTEGAFDPLVRIIDKNVKQNSSITLVLSARHAAPAEDGAVSPWQWVLQK